MEIEPATSALSGLSGRKTGTGLHQPGSLEPVPRRAGPPCTALDAGWTRDRRLLPSDHAERSILEGPWPGPHHIQCGSNPKPGSPTDIPSAASRTRLRRNRGWRPQLPLAHQVSAAKEEADPAKDQGHGARRLAPSTSSSDTRSPAGASPTSEVPARLTTALSGAAALAVPGGGRQLQRSGGELGFLTARGSLLDPADDLSGGIGLQGLEHQLVDVLGHRAGRHLELTRRTRRG